MAFHRPDQFEIDAIRRNLLAKAERARLAAAARGESAAPPSIALQLCQEIRQELAGRWYVPSAWVCKVCVGIGRNGVPARLNAAASEPCRCPGVNMRYRHAR